MRWKLRYANEDAPTVPGIPSQYAPNVAFLNPVGQCSHPGCSGKAYNQEFPGQELKCHQHGGVSASGWSSAALRPPKEINQHRELAELEDQIREIFGIPGNETESAQPARRHVKPVLPSIGVEEPQGIQDYNHLQGITAVPDDEFEQGKSEHGYPSTYLGSKKMNWNERYASAGNDYEHARRCGATHEEAMEAYGKGIPLSIYGSCRREGDTHNEVLEAHDAGIDLGKQYRFARHQLKIPHADIMDAKKQGVSDVAEYADTRFSSKATHQQAIDVCKQGIDTDDYFYERNHGADHETAVKNILSKSSH